MLIKQSCVLSFFLNRSSNFNNFHETFHLNIRNSFKTFQRLRRNTDRLIITLFKSSFLLEFGINCVAFKSSGKQPFLKDKLIIFVRTEASISFVDFLTFQQEYLKLGRFVYHLILKFLCKLTKEELIRRIKGFLNFRNTLMAMKYTIMIARGIRTRFKSKSAVVLTKYLFFKMAKTFLQEIRTSFSLLRFYLDFRTLAIK